MSSPIDTAIKMKRSGAACQYIANTSGLQEDPLRPKEDLMQYSGTSFEGPYSTLDYSAKIEGGQLHLSSKAQLGLLRVLEIDTSGGGVTYIYLPDGAKCSTAIGGNIPKVGAQMTSVKAYTLKKGTY